MDSTLTASQRRRVNTIVSSIIASVDMLYDGRMTDAQHFETNVKWWDALHDMGAPAVDYAKRAIRAAR